MTALSCETAEPLLDLYAADECDPPLRDDLRAHLAECEKCRHALAEARQAAALLDIHFGQPAAIERLRKSIGRETRPAAFYRPRLARFGSLAAMLLVCLGLGLGLGPSGEIPLPLSLAVIKRENIPAIPARGGPDQRKAPAALAMKKETQPIILTFSPGEAREWLAGLKRDDPPLPPRVDLEFVVHNNGREPIRLRGGASVECIVELRGPKVVRRTAPKNAPVPVHLPAGVIPAGGAVTAVYERLAGSRDGRVTYVYPAAPGDYMLTVQIRLTTGPSPGERTTWLATDNPLWLRVGAVGR